ncbi:MAG: DMT family transporter [Treponema sp.]|nr:DMT family transporter [Treponema sp.]
MNKQALRADILLLLTSCIWGFAFVAQRTGMAYLGPFAFNGIRFLLGSLSLLPLIFFLRRRAKAGKGDASPGVSPAQASPKRIVLSSLAAGTCLFVAASLQQIGIIYTTAGHSGFITGLYVVLVPVFGVFLGRKTGLPTWVGAALTLTGLYFLSAAGSAGSVNIGDCITAVSAIFWTFHVLLIDVLVKKVDPLLLSSGQFACCGIFSCIVAAARLEPLAADSLARGMVSILYGGLASVGVAYTLQVVAQKDAPPAHASIILCLEGVFAAAGGALILSEPLGHWTLLGFALMLCGMIATQWDVLFRGFSGKAPGEQNRG